MRLIFDNPHSAQFNMAADETLLKELIGGGSPPTLRLYSWEKPAVSIGYFQKADEIDLDALTKRDWAFVRRPTGGRAVLHWKEVTFCVTMNTEGRGLWEIFRLVHEAIGTGLRRAGINALVLPAQADQEKCRTASCFASPSRYELTLNGKKVAGTAQKQVRDFMLVHGSIPLISTYRELFEVLRFPDDEARETALEKALEKMTSIHEETGIEFAFDELAQKIVEGFSENWKGDLVEERFRPEEISAIKTLSKEKYEE